MSVMTTPTRFVAVNENPGAEIQERRLKLGMSVKGLAERAGIDRGRLAALEAGADNVRDTTIGAVRAALDRIEHEMGMDLPARDLGDGLVEFAIEGNFGVRAVVKGPIRDLAALQEAVSRLVRDMQTDESGNDSADL